jgi:hypothetical protein
MLFYSVKAAALLSQALAQCRPLARTASTATTDVLAHFVFKKVRQRDAVCAIS